MNSSPSTPAPPGPSRGLPPVTPPSGRFIAQLFLVPGMIVLAAVLLLLAFRYLLGGGYTPSDFLKQLDSDNADIRWRGASDLAQVIKRPESVHLRSNPVFALDLAERLRTGLDDLIQEEKHLAEKLAKATPEEKQAGWGRALDARRNYVNFLAATMGDFYVPVGVPLLCEILVRDDSPDPKNVVRRRLALNALCFLGDNTKAFSHLGSEEQAEITSLLAKEAAGTNKDRVLWSRTALHYLQQTDVSPGKSPEFVQVDRVLAQVAQDPDQFLRELVAFAFSFWDGPLAEPTLLKLAQDRGTGTLIGLQE